MSFRATFKQFLPEFVYGGIDGSITTFAVVAGAAGANLDTNVVLILGFANLIADGFSMSVGNFLSEKTAQQSYERQSQHVEHDIAQNMDAQKALLREAYARQGVKGSRLQNLIDAISGHKTVFRKSLLSEVYQSHESGNKPSHSAIMTFFAFCLMGLIPLLTYVWNAYSPIDPKLLFPVACVFTSLAFVLIGWLKSVFTKTNIIRAILETLLLGGLAAILSYAVGDLLEGWLG
ncbi:MAG: VIT1/CCC1 transporter family protein [Bacteroidia bacterium]